MARSTALRWLQAQRCRVREGARQPFLLTDDFTSELGVNVNMNVFWRSGLNLNMYPSYGPLMMTRAFSCAYVTRNGSVENNFMIHCEQFLRMCVWCYLCSFRVCSGMLMLMLLCLHALKTFSIKKKYISGLWCIHICCYRCKRLHRANGKMVIMTGIYEFSLLGLDTPGAM